MAALVDTNVLVYAYDERFPKKQAVAQALLERGAETGDVVLPYQAIVEFTAAVTRTARGEASILAPAEARRVVEELLDAFVVAYPDEALARAAVQGAATYELSWFDALIWAYAARTGLETIFSEDFENGRRYGTVTAIDPFA